MTTIRKFRRYVLVVLMFLLALGCRTLMGTSTPPAPTETPSVSPTSPATGIIYVTEVPLQTATPLPALPSLPPTAPSTGSLPLKIGLLAPLSGDVAVFGKTVEQGVLLAVEEWNARGGVLGRQIEVVSRDSRCNAAAAADAATQIIQTDGVQFIIGEVCSSASIPISDIAEREGVLQISPTSTNPAVTVDALGNTKSFIFRACFVDPYQGQAMARFALDTLKAQTAAVLLNPENDYVHNLARNFRDTFEAAGNPVLWQAYPDGTVDFGPFLSVIQEEHPDVLYLPDYYLTVNFIAAQARARGMTVILLGGDGWDSADLDRQATEGGYYTNHYAADDPALVNQAWRQRFEARYATTPDAMATLGYEAATLLLSALAQAGADDPAQVAQTLAGMEVAGVTGAIRFDAEHNPLKEVKIFRVEADGVVFAASVRP